MIENKTRLDAWVPHPDAREIHSLIVDSPPQLIFAALKSKPLHFRGVSRGLMAVRFIGEALAMTLKGNSDQLAAKNSKESSFVDMALRLGFVILEETSDQELILGFVGRFWQLVPEILTIKAEDFRAFDRPGYAKAIVNFKLTPVDETSYSLSTETRVKGCDTRSRRMLRCYWFLIRPFSGLIRHDMLRGLAEAAKTA